MSSRVFVCRWGVCIHKDGNIKSEKNAKFYSGLGRNTDVAHVQNLGKSTYERQENWMENTKCQRKELRLKNVIGK